MNIPNIDYLKSEIKYRITKNFPVVEIILFGSYAKGEENPASDIDLIVILDKHGFCKTYLDKIEQRLSIARLFRDIKTEFPMDILVYTKDEWKILQNAGTSFIKEIESTGVKVA